MTRNLRPNIISTKIKSIDASQKLIVKINCENNKEYFNDNQLFKIV